MNTSTKQHKNFLYASTLTALVTLAGCSATQNKTTANRNVSAANNNDSGLTNTSMTPSANVTTRPEVADAASITDTTAATPAPARPDLSNAKVPSDSDAAKLVATDLASNDNTGAVIYVDIRHLVKAKNGTSDLEVYRFAIAKVLNSVSLNPKIVALSPVDPGETLFRVKLSDYTLGQGWQYVIGEKHAHANSTKWGSATVVKGDWLVYAISRPEVYDMIMNIPASVPAFEAQLKPDYSKAIYINAVDSTVTFFGRVLQRIPLEIGGKPGGYYWRSYDIDGLDEQLAAFAAPAALRFATLPTLVAGEYFFSLPNGLQGYYVSGFAMQTRLDAQLFVATDSRRPEDGLTTCVGGVPNCGFVLNGESCMTCHENGINPPKTVQGTSGASRTAIADFLTQDQKRFKGALAEMGYTIGGEPIHATLTTFRQRTGTSDARVQGGEFEGVAVVGHMLKR